MAVTVITKPSATVLQTSSYFIPVTLSSDKVGTPNITQHKFYLEIIIEGVSIGFKYFTILTGNQATADIGAIVKNYILLSRQVDHPVQGAIPLPQINLYPEILDLDPPDIGDITVNTGENYYDTGVFTNNPGASFSFKSTRGFTSTPSDWKEANFTDGNILPTPAQYRIPYSGYEYRSFAFNVRRFYTTPADIYFLFNFYASNGGVETLVFTKEIDATVLDFVVYLPMFFAGYTDQDDFENLRIEIKNDSTSPATTTVYTYNFPRTINYCGEKMVTLMYSDPFFQWQFISFPLKSYNTLNKQSERFEAAEAGRSDFNIKAQELIRINTDLLREDQNKYYEWLFLSEEIYIVGNSWLADDIGITESYNELTKVTIEQSRFAVRTIRSQGTVQYQFEIQKSKNTFIP